MHCCAYVPYLKYRLLDKALKYLFGITHNVCIWVVQPFKTARKLIKCITAPVLFFERGQKLNEMWKLILLMIVFIVVVIWLLNKLINSVFNIITLIRKNTDKHEGIIYNPKTKKLEADESKITLF